MLRPGAQEVVDEAADLRVRYEALKKLSTEKLNEVAELLAKVCVRGRGWGSVWGGGACMGACLCVCACVFVKVCVCVGELGVYSSTVSWSWWQLSSLLCSGSKV